jgi:hypothetical protein
VVPGLSSTLIVSDANQNYRTAGLRVFVFDWIGAVALNEMS